jgi:hypothetical protein
MAFTFPGGRAQALIDSKAQVVALQSGSTFQFKGYDITPSNNDLSDDWFGPGALSSPQQLTGRLGRFYTLSPAAHLSETLYRRSQPGYWGFDGEFQNWYTWADFDGIAIHQWALETPDGKGGYLELSQDAAEALFGTGPLVTASANPVAYPGGGSYWDFTVPAGGLATRFEVFTQWGKDVPGYAPSSLAPAQTLNAPNMHVGLNPRNAFTQFMENAYAITYNLTYNTSLVRGGGSVRRPWQVPGPGPGLRLPRPAGMSAALRSRP